MGRIPRTLQEFERMEFMTQKEVKSKLMLNIYSDLCNAISPEFINKFAPVLHPGDLETISLSRNRDSSASVISKLLMIIKKSLNRQPTWWQLLEEVLLQIQNDSLYYSMNPWLNRRRPPSGGAAYDDRHGREGGRGGPQYWPRPISQQPSYIPHPTGPPVPQRPYPKGLPLALTQGIPELLIGLCAVEEQWRDLAKKLGLVQGEILEIRKRTEGSTSTSNIADHIIEHLMTKFGNQASVGMLTEALLAMSNRCGREVVKRMQDARLIQPLEGAAGRAAGGDRGGGGERENVDAVEGGSTSSQAPVGQSHLGHNTHTATVLPHVTSGTADQPPPSASRLFRDTGISNPQSQSNPSSIEANLSGKEPIKETRQPSLDNLHHESKDLQRSTSDSLVPQQELMGQNSKPVQRTYSMPATASSVAGNKILHSSSSSTASIDDNSLYESTTRLADPSGATADQLPRENKVLNISHLSQASTEGATNQLDCADNGKAEAKGRDTNFQGRSLRTDSPSPCTGPDGSASLDSCQDVNNISQDQKSREDGGKGGNIYINVKNVGVLQVGTENKIISASQDQQEQARREEDCSEPVAQQENPQLEEHQLPLPTTEEEPQPIPGQPLQHVSHLEKPEDEGSCLPPPIAEEPQPIPGQGENNVATAYDEQLPGVPPFQEVLPPVSRCLQTASMPPFPFDYEAHQTAMKQLHSINPNEEEEREMGEEGNGEEEEMSEERRTTVEYHPSSVAGLPQLPSLHSDCSYDVDLQKVRLSGEGPHNNATEIAEPPQPHPEQEMPVPQPHPEQEMPAPQPHPEQEMPAPLQQQQQLLEAIPRRGVLTRVLSSIIDIYKNIE